jgi:predicted AAA+ superfamily ATPase
VDHGTGLWRLKHSRVVALIGPRQSGKTTLMRPDLSPVLRVLADRKPVRARFMILGSASSELLRQSSESLAGRLETIPVAGFALSEVGMTACRQTLVAWRISSGLSRTNVR